MIDHMRKALGGETLSAGTGHHRIGIAHLEAPILEVIAEIQFGASHKQSAFRIDDHPDSCRFDENIPVGRPIDEIHLVLEPGAASSHHSDPQRSGFFPALLAEQ